MQSTLRGVIGILGFGVDAQCIAEFLETMPEVKEVSVFDERITNAEIRKYGNTKIGISLEGIDLLFRSPGFPLTHPLLKEAKKKGIPVTSSTTYFLQNFPGKTVGVTGSNGKTTCTTLIAEMLRKEFGKENVEEGGNDRKPRLDLFTTHYSLPTTHYTVLELSSFQLMDCPMSPNVAVVLNITPNHLDWHATMEEYAEAKRQIVANQKAGDIAILNSNPIPLPSALQSRLPVLSMFPKRTFRKSSPPSVVLLTAWSSSENSK